MSQEKRSNLIHWLKSRGGGILLPCHEGSPAGKTKHPVLGIGVLIFCLAVLIFSLPAQAGNETLTLETYYPAPYGIYNEFTTTGQTLLATESGSVGIGTPTPGAKLEVLGGQIINATSGQNAYIDFQVNGTTGGNIWLDGASNYLGINSMGTNTILNPAGGNVGIGLNDPSALLHIHRDGESVVYKVTSNGGRSSNFPGIRAGHHLSGTSKTGPGYAVYHDDGDNSFHINYDQTLGSATNHAMTITHTSANPEIGIVGINTGSGPECRGPLCMGWVYSTSYVLDVNGGARFNGKTYCTDGLWSGSDLRWKKNIVTLPGPLEKLSRLRGVEFDWKQEEYKENNFPAGRQIGIIAQELEKEFPELVSTDKSGYKSIAYDKLTAVLLEAVKELDAKYKAGIAESETEHKKEVKKLESEISDLSNELKKK